MITLYRFDENWLTVFGEDALRLHEAGYAIIHAESTSAVFIPVDSMTFHIWQLLTLDDVCLGKKVFTVTDRRAYNRYWLAFTGRLRTKSWKHAKEDFEFNTHSMIVEREEWAQQMPLF